MPQPSVTRIYLRPGRELPVKEVTVARAVQDQGLDGDHAQGGRRQVTMLEAGRWQEVCEALGTALDPGARRANLVLEGVDLQALRGSRLRIGAAVIEVLGETTPCGLMDRTCKGLGDALAPDWRGGAYGRILEGGEISVGDLVSQLDQDC